VGVKISVCCGVTGGIFTPVAARIKAIAPACKNPDIRVERFGEAYMFDHLPALLHAA
jgi:hypothetical protein